MHLKNGKTLYNEGGITFFHETERYVNNLNIYNRSKNGTNLWDDLIYEYIIRIYNILYEYIIIWIYLYNRKNIFLTTIQY